LHPDRESDSAVRQQKQQLLSDLLKARKANDILTLLEIYGKALNKPQIDLAEKELTTICDMLSEQLDELKLEQENYLHAHPDRVVVHDLFYHKNKKKREQSLKRWQQELEMEAEQNHHLVTYLHNLTNLKDVLSDRREQRHQFIDFVMEEFYSVPE
jgi:hypothetical protein